LELVMDGSRALENFIARHQLKDGDRLPPERELALTLDISRRELRQILARLELEGRIWRGKRNGTLLGKQPPAVNLSVDRSLTRASPRSIMECRLLLEPAAAALAALNASETDLANIELCARRTAEVADDADWTRWDGAFHSAIAQSTRNPIVESMVQSFNLARTRPEWSAARVAMVKPENRRQEAAHHRKIAEAIRRRDGAGANQAMRDHLLGVQDDLSELFG
jgi:DNA-binding FadR family transcriptional regulator